MRVEDQILEELMGQHWRKPPLRPRMSITEKVCLSVVAFAIVLLFALIATSELVLAAELATTQCPTPGQPCKIIVLSPQEEDMLVKQGGILDSAAAGRYLDLGNIAAYFRMKLMQAPAGETKPVPSASPTPPAAPQPSEEKQ